MDKSQTRSRKRPITACIECVRRKQRCDRGKPCNNCTARGVEDKCVFPSGLSHPNESHTKQHESSDLAVALGYPPENKMVHTLHDLQHPLASGPWPSNHNGNSHQSEALSSSSNYHIVVSRLPPEAITDQIVNIFFVEAGWYFCLVDRPYYDELLRLWRACQATATSPDAESSQTESIVFANAKTTFVRHVQEIRYFPAMLFQILALALHFLPKSCRIREILKLTDQAVADKMSKLWSDNGHEIMSTLGRIDSPLTGVLADLLRCTWLKNSGLGGHAWHALSDAVRQAQNLRLHQKAIVPQAGAVEDTLRNLWRDEHRRRVWISVFSWDAHMALSLDRPRLVIVGDCTAEAPLDCDLPTEPSKVVPTAAGLAGQPSRYTSQLFKYSTGLLIHEAMSSGALRSPCKDYGLITALHQKINDLVKDLPMAYHSDSAHTTHDLIQTDVSRQFQQIAILASSLIMSLHRPQAMHRATSRSAAITAALDTLSASQWLFELCDEQHYKIHTILFHTIDAVIFLSSMVMAHSQSDADASGLHKKDLPYHSIRLALHQAVRRVAKMKKRSKVAREAEKALRKCHELVARHEQEYLSPVGTGIFDRTQSSASSETWTPSSNQDPFTESSISPNSSIHIGNHHLAALPPTTSYPPLFPESMDTSAFDDLSEFLNDPKVIDSASHTSAWMEQHGFAEDVLFASDPTLGWDFLDWSYG